MNIVVDDKHYRLTNLGEQEKSMAEVIRHMLALGYTVRRWPNGVVSATNGMSQFGSASPRVLLMAVEVQVTRRDRGKDH
jgi:hypothetical protein